jgi:nicotinate dehydrogenase subunit B
MAPVIRQLAQVPDADIAAMAQSLASFQEQQPTQTSRSQLTSLADAASETSAISPAGVSIAALPTTSASALAAQIYVAQAAAREPLLLGPTQRMFQAACASCHQTRLIIAQK